MDRIKLGWQNKPYKGWRLAVLLLISVLLLIRIFVWISVENSNHQTSREHLNSVVQADIMQLQNKFEVYADTLYSGRALFMTDNSVSAQNWTNFVDAQFIKQRYPGINGISYVSMIPSSQTASLNEKINSESTNVKRKSFAIHPSSNERNLAVITYNAPDDTNQQVIDYNLLSSPARAKTLSAARDSGLPRASTPLDLVGDKSPEKSLIIAMAVYAQGSTLTSATSREMATNGYVVMGLHINPLLDSIFKHPSSNDALGVRISTNQQEIYSTGAAASGRHLNKAEVVNVGGQAWRLDFSAPENFGLNATAKGATTVMLLSGITLLLITLVAVYYSFRFKVLKTHHKQHHHGTSKHEHKHDKN